MKISHSASPRNRSSRSSRFADRRRRDPERGTGRRRHGLRHGLLHRRGVGVRGGDAGVGRQGSGNSIGSGVSSGTVCNGGGCALARDRPEYDSAKCTGPQMARKLRGCKAARFAIRPELCSNHDDECAVHFYHPRGRRRRGVWRRQNFSI